MAETILLVEDEPIIRMDLADHLTAAGYEVSEAASADRAIDLISQGTIFDLIVTDAGQTRWRRVGALGQGQSSIH
jgi:CheY-like chemotaxis protein